MLGQVGFAQLNCRTHLVWQSGPSLEHMLGTLTYLLLISCFVISLGMLYFGIALGLLVSAGFERFFRECAIGFSG